MRRVADRKSGGAVTQAARPPRCVAARPVWAVSRFDVQRRGLARVVDGGRTAGSLVVTPGDLVAAHVPVQDLQAGTRPTATYCRRACRPGDARPQVGPANEGPSTALGGARDGPWCGRGRGPPTGPQCSWGRHRVQRHRQHLQERRVGVDPGAAVLRALLRGDIGGGPG